MTKFKFLSLFIITTLTFAYNSITFAAGHPASNQPSDFYFAVGIGQSELDFQDEKESVNALKFKGGVFLQENVALEFAYGLGLTEAKLENSVDVLDVDSWYSLQIRLQSPHYQGFRIYVQGGFSKLELSNSISLTEDEKLDSISGGIWAFGVEQRVSSNFPLWVYLDFSKINDDVNVYLTDLGIRYDF